MTTYHRLCKEAEDAKHTYLVTRYAKIRPEARHLTTLCDKKIAAEERRDAYAASTARLFERAINALSTACKNCGNDNPCYYDREDCSATRILESAGKLMVKYAKKESK